MSTRLISNGVAGAAEGFFGMALGSIIDGIFPAPDPDAPFAAKVLEVGAQMGVFGAMTALSGPFILGTINPSNSTNGFPFLVGMMAAQQNFQAKAADVSLQLKEEAIKLLAPSESE